MTDGREPTTALYVVGPSSTGKTTLCDALARSLTLAPSRYVTQVARRVMRERGFTREDVGRLEMQHAIMSAQLAREDAVCAQARAAATATATTGESLVLCDRSGIDPVVYAVLTAQDADEGRERKRVLLDDPALQAALERYRTAKFLLLRPVPEWLVDDGVRTLEQQARCFDVYRAVLAELGIPHRELGAEVKALSARVEWVKGWIATDPAGPTDL